MEVQLQKGPDKLLKMALVAEERAIGKGQLATDPNTKRVVSRFLNGAVQCESCLVDGDPESAKEVLTKFGFQVAG